MIQYIPAILNKEQIRLLGEPRPVHYSDGELLPHSCNMCTCVVVMKKAAVSVDEGKRRFERNTRSDVYRSVPVHQLV